MRETRCCAVWYWGQRSRLSRAVLEVETRVGKSCMGKIKSLDWVCVDIHAGSFSRIGQLDGNKCEWDSKTRHSWDEFGRQKKQKGLSLESCMSKWVAVARFGAARASPTRSESILTYGGRWATRQCPGDYGRTNKQTPSFVQSGLGCENPVVPFPFFKGVGNDHRCSQWKMM